MNTLDYIAKKYNIDLSQSNPIEIRNAGRGTLASLFKELGFKVGAEVGVERGKYSEVLCTKNPGVRLYAIDYWTSYSGYRDYTSQSKLDRFYEEVKERLKDFNCKIIKKSSVEAAKDFEDNSLDFVYIDANHEFRHVVEDISAWIKKVRPGGIISGHDYRRATKAKYLHHVVEAVQGYTKAYFVKPWFILGIRRAKNKGEIRDKRRSWFWVKE